MFARIYVEMELSRGLLDIIHIIDKDLKWTRTLDFENTAFRCRVCYQGGNLQNTCALLKKKATKKAQNKKGCQFPDTQLSDEEEEEIKENQMQTETKNQQETQDMAVGKMEEKQENDENTSPPISTDPQQDEQVGVRGVVGTKHV